MCVCVCVCVIECFAASSFYYIFTYSTWKALTAICSFYFHLEYNLKNVTHVYLVYIFKHMLFYHFCPIDDNGANLFMYSSKFVSNVLKIFFNLKFHLGIFLNRFPSLSPLKKSLVSILLQIYRLFNTMIFMNNPISFS